MANDSARKESENASGRSAGRTGRRDVKIEAQRWAFFVVGVCINSFGIALITKAAMGTSPISSVAYVLSLEFPLTLGEFTFIVNMLFIAAQAAMLGRKFDPFQLLQIVVNVLFSALIDVSMMLLWWLDAPGIAESAVALLVGCAILGFGVAIEVAPGVLMVPGEGVVRVLSIVTHKRFGSVKVAFDTSLVAIAAVLSFLFFGGLNGIGLGTLVSALIVGRFVNLFNAHVPLLGYIVNLRIKSDHLKNAAAS